MKDWADLNHPNAVTPPINLFYIGWTSDGEWTNYTVDVKEPGTYSIKALYSHKATAVGFDLNGKPAATGQVPRATESWHHWDYGPIGDDHLPRGRASAPDLPLRQRQQLGLLGVREGRSRRPPRGSRGYVPDSHQHDLAELARHEPPPGHPAHRHGHGRDARRRREADPRRALAAHRRAARPRHHLLPGQRPPVLQPAAGVRGRGRRARLHRRERHVRRRPGPGDLLRLPRARRRAAGGQPGAGHSRGRGRALRQALRLHRADETRRSSTRPGPTTRGCRSSTTCWRSTTTC